MNIKQELNPLKRAISKNCPLPLFSRKEEGFESRINYQEPDRDGRRSKGGFFVGAWGPAGRSGQAICMGPLGRSGLISRRPALPPRRNNLLTCPLYLHNTVSALLLVSSSGSPRKIVFGLLSNSGGTAVLY
ncbi:unnamed protein product [Nezara viridula]|uniref:Uncharacterized protein n=1 Tax=Nezara viridula TaxID=85310 RepID=A0A9P0ME89_NEZVI|nr:unnamed protein product [Nezara viridula]